MYIYKGVISVPNSKLCAFLANRQTDFFKNHYKSYDIRSELVGNTCM